jgi:hypothetical protein
MDFNSMLWSWRWSLRTKLHLHVRHIICIYEYYAYYTELNCIEIFQARNSGGWDDISAELYLCYNMFSMLQFSLKIV